MFFLSCPEARVCQKSKTGLNAECGTWRFDGKLAFRLAKTNTAVKQLEGFLFSEVLPPSTIARGPTNQT